MYSFIRYNSEDKAAADQGDVNAQAFIGFCYENGLGISKDEKEACRYYKMAADKGQIDAQNNLAECYKKGKGIEQNEEEASKYYKLAADQGHISAQNNLSIRYQVGRGIQKNIELAVIYHIKATTVSKDQLPSQLKSDRVFEKILLDSPSFLLKIFDNKSTKGVNSLADYIFSPEVDLNKSYILLHPPQIKNQRGPTCGLYALEIALTASYPHRLIPPARKNPMKPTAQEKFENKKIISLRQIAKKHGSVTGAVYDMFCLKKTAVELGFHECEIIKSQKNNYIKNILKSIQTGHYVILPVDEKDGFPYYMKGKALHYALAWGFIFKDNTYHFLVTHWGKHYLWNSYAFRASHDQMPDQNVHASGEYYKDHVRDDYYPKEQDQKIPDCDLRQIPITSLENFKYTALTVPSGKKNFLVVRDSNEEKSVYSAVKLNNAHLGLRFLFNMNNKNEKVKENDLPKDKYVSLKTI